MYWKMMFFAIFALANTVFGVTPQLIHKSFVLSHKGFEKEAKDLLKQSLLDKTFEERFLADQFVDWSVKNSCEMKKNFNQSAFYILSGNKKQAKRALLDYFNEDSDGLKDFANHFVDWGIHIMKISSTAQNGTKS